MLVCKVFFEIIIASRKIIISTKRLSILLPFHVAGIYFLNIFFQNRFSPLEIPSASISEKHVHKFNHLVARPIRGSVCDFSSNIHRGTGQAQLLAISRRNTNPDFRNLYILKKIGNISNSSNNIFIIHNLSFQII